MLRFFLFSLIVLLSSCTDQGDPIKYSLSNTCSYNFEVILYGKTGKPDTTSINKNEFSILDEQVPPYDSGPFAYYDSISVQFENFKRLTYLPPGTYSECVDSIKNPFCPYSNYYCLNDICTFKIDNFEYLKAK